MSERKVEGRFDVYHQNLVLAAECLARGIGWAGFFIGLGIVLAEWLV